MKNNTVKSIVMDTVRKQLLLSLVLIISVVLSVGFSLLPPLILERIVDVLSENRDFDYYLAVLYFLTVCFSGVSDSSKEVIITVFGQKVTHSIRSALSVKLNFLPSSYYVKNESGVTSSIFVNDVNTVENLFSSGIISMICDLIKLVAIIIIIFTRSVGLGIILIIVTPFVFYLTRVFQKCMLKAQSDNRRAIANINQQIPDAINCMRTIHLLNGEDFMLKRYGKSIDLSYDAQERSNFYDSVYSPIIVSISAFLIGLVMAFSAQSGTIRFFFGMSAGSAAAIIAYIGNFFTPLENIGMEIQNIQSAIAGIKRIDSFLNESEEVKTEAEHHEYCSAVEIKDIDFSYDKNSQLIFEGFSLNIEEGETVVI
ncbi:MAG: ABC transporter transmembrane domain-containing protein, partial [Erysipelotrichaceae bacterium]